MKKTAVFCWVVCLLLSTVQIAAADVVLNEKNIPDANFRSFLSTWDFGWTEYDSDGNPYTQGANDGVLHGVELAAFPNTFSTETFGGASTLKGIELFPGLYELYCLDDHMGELDVSQNSALQILDCKGNDLKELDVRNNTALTYLVCRENQLKNIDVSSNRSLTYFVCRENQLEKLNVRNNTALEWLDCVDNNLKELDVRNNHALTWLAFNDNDVREIDVSGCPNLSELHCNGNSMDKLYVGNNTALKNLSCADNCLTELDLSNNQALSIINCAHQQATGLKVKAVDGGYEVCLKDYVSNVENIDISTVGANNYSARFLSYDGTTGTVLFAERPKTLHYQYMTHSPNNVKMDVTIKASFTVDVIERGGPTENIIYGMKDNCYLDSAGNALTESSIANLSAKKYAKKGFVADGNSRLILRVQTTRPGSVTFTLKDDIGVQVERMTDRADITGTNYYLSTEQTGSNTHQASAVLIAPEMYPELRLLPSSKFTVHVKFTALSENGEEIPEEERVLEEDIELELHAAPVVLIHGFSPKQHEAENVFAKDGKGVLPILEQAGFTVYSWKYDSSKGPSDILAPSPNGLFNQLLIAFEEFRRKGIVCTKADLVGYDTGGLIARRFCVPEQMSEKNYYTSRSYKKGMVRRIIFIAVPNRGTPWANCIMGDFKVLDPDGIFSLSATGYLKLGMLFRRLVIEPLAPMFGYDNEAKYHNARLDMAVNSPIVTGAYPVNVPMFAIYGKVGEEWEVINKAIASLCDLFVFWKNAYREYSRGKDWGNILDKMDEMGLSWPQKSLKRIEGITEWDDVKMWEEFFGMMAEFEKDDAVNIARMLKQDVDAMRRDYLLGELISKKDEIFGFMPPLNKLVNALWNCTLDTIVLYFSEALLGVGSIVEYPLHILNALFSRREHDLYVSANSAAGDMGGASIGMYGWKYRHSSICRQDDTGREVMYALKKNKSELKTFTTLTSGVSPNNYSKTLNASSAGAEGGDDLDLELDDLYVKGLTLKADPALLEIADTGSIKITAEAEEVLDGTVYLKFLKNNEDEERIYPMYSTDGKNFELTVEFSSQDAGIIELSCFSHFNGSKIYTSEPITITIRPDSERLNISGLMFRHKDSVVFAGTDSEIAAGLYAIAEDGTKIDVSSPVMGTVWTSSSPDIAYVTDDGMIHAIANGTAKITAEYAGLSASIFINVGNEFTAPQILTSTADNAEEGLKYSYTLQASGTPLISWRLIDRRLPGGLELSPSGEISGTPEEQGIFTFTVEASNIAGSDSREVSIIVGASTGNYTIFNENNFPDENFRNCILNTIDYDKNGYVSDEEITSTKVVNVSGQGISSLKGIEYFTSLEYLMCDNNNISELDLSANVNLLGLSCGNNSLKALDLSNHQKLQGIWGTDNNLESLNVDNCPALEVISVFRNNLSSIELKNCPSLKELSCWGNSIVEIDISGCPNLDPDKFYYDQNVTVIRSRPAFKVANLILSGQIGVNFFLNLPEIQGVDYYNGKSCYMAFDINGNNTSNNPQPTDGSFKQENYFGYRCYVNSVQMADPITADFHYGNGKTVSYVYTVKRYLDNKITGSKDEAMRKLAAAIKNYGHYAQIYLSRINGWKIGEKHVELEAASEYTASEIDEVRQIAPQYKPVLDDFSDTGISGVQYNLELAAETTINLTLKIDSGYSGSVFASLNGGSENMAVRQSDGTYRVQIAGISAHRLADTQTVKVTAAKDFTVKVSALTFVYNSLRNTSTAEDRQKLAVALYRYYTSTMDYKNSPKN